MGYILHHTIIVTSWSDDLKSAHQKAIELFEKSHVTAQYPSSINGYCTFYVIPDGSKEGWSESDSGDAKRAQFIAWLKQQQYEDGSSWLDWCEVSYSSDSGGATISDSKWKEPQS